MVETENQPLDHLVRDLECRGLDKDYRPVFDNAIKVPVLIDLVKGTACPLCPYDVKRSTQICHAAAVQEKGDSNYSFPACPLGKD